MSNSVRPHRWQPTRFRRPWDPPGKNTAVGCHFLLQCMKVKSQSEVAQLCPTLSDLMDYMQPTRLLRPWDFSGRSTGVGVPLPSLRAQARQKRKLSSQEKGPDGAHVRGRCSSLQTAALPLPQPQGQPGKSQIFRSENSSLVPV